ncbi:PREDICTED: uncharacterized protein LOC105561908 [Vollenhovia emeryi]|uniref:uncharacterized protein LOC105561908 n=1 Tax=Vollenhovia emeryi TaxID=411798 RepID=UPI0005F40E54|nr:PREDICTED: uncharacterized protein LOC105561908 [Vollenhovia emeryi]
MNLNTVSCDAEGSIEYKKAVEPLAKNVSNRSTEYTRPTTSEYREHRRILDLNQDCLQRTEDDSNHYSTCVATGSQNISTNKLNRHFDEKPYNTKLKKIRNGLKLRIIVHKVYLEDYKHSTFSSFNVTRLPLPCKPSNLIRRIFKADPSLTECCLIVIKRKFENSMYNICSCLNSILEKFNAKLTRALCLNCEIYPGYINFKMKANNIKKCLFVARVPICQNVCKRVIPQDYPIFSSKVNSSPSTEIESKCLEQYKDDGTNLNDTLEHNDTEKTEEFDTPYSQLDQSFIKDVAIDISENEAESNNEEMITCMITDCENVSRCVQNLAISSCNNSCKDIIQEISNDMSLCVDHSEERNGEDCEVVNATEINCDNDTEKCQEEIFESSNSITKTDTSAQLVDNVNCTCSSYENLIERNDEIENTFSNKDLDGSSQTVGINDWICSMNKKSNPENKVCNTDTCSITSFVQNSEYDKQLVELNYNHFSNSNINAIDKRFDKEENDNSLNSARAEIGCNSYCSCQRDDFIDITVIDDISKENIVCAFKTSRNNFDTVEAPSTDRSTTVQISPRNNNLLTISIHMPRSTIVSRGINVDTCYSRAPWLTSDDDKNISTVTERSDRCNEIASLSTYALIASRKENKILPGKKKKIFDVKDGTQNCIISPKSFSTSKERFRSDEESRDSNISTGEYLRAKNHSMCATSNESLYYRAFATTSKFTMNNKRNKLQKSDKSRKLSKLHGCGYVRSRNDIRNITSTMIKHKTKSCRYPNGHPMMTKFRNSVDKSVDRIKHLIRTKLRRILFKNKISNNNKMTKTCWRNKKSVQVTRRKKTSGKRIRQNYSMTLCSTCDCCRQDYTISSCESSNMIPSIRRTKRKPSEGTMKFCDHKLTDDSKGMLSSRSIKASPWSYDLLTSTTEDVEKLKLNKNNRYNRKERNRNTVDYNRNSHRYDLKHSGTSITISSQSTKVSLIENNSKHFERYMYKRQKEICDKPIYEQGYYNQDQRENKQVRHEYGQFEKKNKYRDLPIKYTNGDSYESLKTSYTRKGNTRNMHQQLFDISGLRNGKRFASSRKNQQIFENNVSGRHDNSLRSNNNLRKRPVFTTLTDAYNDYMDDLDLDFKLRLLRYGELCKSIKRSLIRTLRPDDVSDVSTASVSDSDL